MDTKRFLPRRGPGNGSDEDRFLFELQAWVLSFAPSVWLIDIQPYESCRVAGVVRKLRIDPKGGSIDAVITDGTGEASARWQIRRPTPQLAVAPGRGVVLEGLTTLVPDGSVGFDEPHFVVFDLGSGLEGDE